MDNNANNNQIRKISAGGRDSTLLYQNINSNINIDSGKQKDEKKRGYSLFVKNMAKFIKSKKYKSVEKRKKKESAEEQEKKNPKKLTYMEKFQRSTKPKETFQSTTKNPKINEILRQLRESEEKSNASGNSNIKIGKIDSNKINKFLGNKDNKENNEKNNLYESKVKNYVDKLNKMAGEKANTEENKKKQITIIRKNLKEKEFIDNIDEVESSSSEDEYDRVRRNTKKHKKKKKLNDIQLLQKENNNTFYILGQDQEKYLHQKNNIIYTRFSFKTIKLKDKKYQAKEKSDSKNYIPKNQIFFTILSESTKQRKKSNARSNLNNNIKFSNLKSHKIKIKRKKTSLDTNESEGNEGVKFFDIVGYDRKKKRMSIYDILKKRNIAIKSEEPFNLSRDKKSLSIKVSNKSKKKEMKVIKEQNEINEKKENTEIHKYDEMVKYVIFSTVTNIRRPRKFNLKDLEISKIENIELNNEEQSENVLHKANNLMIIEKKNDIKKYEKKRSGSNSKYKNKNSFNRKSKDKDKDNINNNSISLINKKDNQKINNNLFPNKHSLKNRISIIRTNKSTEKRNIKSSLIFDSSSSEREEKEEKEIKEEKNESKNNKRVLNKQFDELFHNYATNYETENKPKRIDENNLEINTEIINNTISSRKNNALKKNMERASIYTDRETNESRALFKKRLQISNNFLNDDINLSKNEIHKVKANKAKIKKFKSKNVLEHNQTQTNSSGFKKITNLNNKKYTDKTARIRQFHKQRNFNSDYFNNSNNIILQNTTVNHTTYNYYLNNQDRFSSLKKSTKRAKNKK